MTPPIEAPPYVDDVREFLVTFGRALRDHKTYPSNNPILSRRRDDLYQRLRGLHEKLGELILEVNGEALVYQGAEVYRADDPRESLAFLLYRHGLREISFERGINPDELAGVVRALATEIVLGEGDDDLLTLLWSQDLRFVRYTAVDDTAEGAAWARDPVGAIGRVADRIPEVPAPECYRSVLRALATRPLASQPDPAALALTPEDQAALDKLAQEELQRDVAVDVVDVLLQVMQQPLTPQAAIEMVRVLTGVVEASVEERAFGRAAGLLAHIVELATSSKEAGEALRPVREHFADRHFLRRIIKVLNESTVEQPPPGSRDLLTIVSLLGTAAIAPLAELSCDVQDKGIRRTLCGAIADLARTDVMQLATATRASRWFVPRNAAYIIGQTKHPDGPKLLRPLFDHAHEKVRYEALRAAAEFPPDSVRDIVGKAITDADRGIRLFALELAPRAPTPVIIEKLIVRLRGGAETDLGERRALAIALGRAAGETVLHLFRDSLVKRSLFSRNKIDDTRIAAVAGLVAIGGPAAEGILESVVTAEPGFAPIVEEAHRDIGRAREPQR